MGLGDQETCAGEKQRDAHENHGLSSLGVIVALRHRLLAMLVQASGRPILGAGDHERSAQLVFQAALIYALCGDGDLMEGVAAEAASLAGHLRLANLCWIYDNNRITIEGATSLAFSEDVPARFAGYGWAVQHVSDANDLTALVGDPNVSMHEGKALMVNVEKA